MQGFAKTSCTFQLELWLGEDVGGLDVRNGIQTASGKHISMEDKAIAQLFTLYSFLPTFHNKKGILKNNPCLAYTPTALIHGHTFFF